jgi:hypothetical protein
MIREVCSCGAEIETDLPDQLDIVTKWRKTHRHITRTESHDQTSLTNTDIALGFQVEYEDDNDLVKTRQKPRK